MSFNLAVLYDVARNSSNVQFFTRTQNIWTAWVQLHKTLHRIREHPLRNWLTYYLMQYCMSDVIYEMREYGALDFWKTAEFKYAEQLIEELKNYVCVKDGYPPLGKFYKLMAEQDTDRRAKREKLSPLPWLSNPVAYNKLYFACSESQGTNHSIQFKLNNVYFWQLGVHSYDYFALCKTAMPELSLQDRDHTTQELLLYRDITEGFTEKPDYFNLLYAQRPSVLSSLRWFVSFDWRAHEFVRDIPWIREHLIEEEIDRVDATAPATYCVFANLTEARRFVTRIKREKIFSLTDWAVTRQAAAWRGRRNEEYIWHLLITNAKHSYQAWKKQ